MVDAAFGTDFQPVVAILATSRFDVAFGAVTASAFDTASATPCFGEAFDVVCIFDVVFNMVSATPRFDVAFDAVPIFLHCIITLLGALPTAVPPQHSQNRDRL